MRKNLQILFILLCFQTVMMFSRSSVLENRITIKCLSNQELLEDSSMQDTLKNVYINAFKAVYSDYWTEAFEERQMNFFSNNVEHYKSSDDMVLIVATINNHLAGWSLFCIKNPHYAVLEILCISPEFWRYGLGKKLVFAIQENSPEVSRIVVCTQKINLISPLFYQAIGFKKTDITLPEYEGLAMQGFEWHKE